MFFLSSSQDAFVDASQKKRMRPYLFRVASKWGKPYVGFIALGSLGQRVQFPLHEAVLHFQLADAGLQTRGVLLHSFFSLSPYIV